MRLAWLTDIHLDVRTVTEEKVRKLCKEAQLRAEALLVTGDIAEAPTFKTHLERLSKYFQGRIYFCLGNHDRYGDTLIGSQARAAALSAPFHYLTMSDPVPLSDKVGLIGDDGFYDAKAGVMDLTRFCVRDLFDITDFGQVMCSRGYPRETVLVSMIRQQADAAALRLEVKLEAALKVFDHVIVATHVPPFVEASKYRGKQDSKESLPFYCSVTIGDVIYAAATENPNKKITVFCGHTHDPAHVKITDNLECYVGGADYGEPTINKILVVGDTLEVRPLTVEPQSE